MIFNPHVSVHGVTLPSPSWARISTVLPKHAPAAHRPGQATAVAAANFHSGCRHQPRQLHLTAAAANSGTATLPRQQAQQQGSSLRGLYPASTPHASGYLQVSKLHRVYYEVHGNPQGVPAIVVHGGPGAGCFPNHARFFDPAHYRIILLDQRGCGRSTPTGCLAENTTADLVNDLELLRKTLGVQQWLMLGGSWGVALSIAYAQAHPYAVLGLVLRGVCLMRPSEIQWMYGGGAAALKPLAWSNFVGQLPAREQGNPVLGYYKRLLSKDASVRQAAAKAWMSWEMSVGFSTSQDLLVWNGRSWDNQAAPAYQQPQQLQRSMLLPPPPPPSNSYANAAAAVETLNRGRGAVAVSTSNKPHDRNGSLSRNANIYNKNCTPPPAACTSVTNNSVRSPQMLEQQSNSVTSHRSSSVTRRVANVNPQPAWVWRLPGQGYNSQDHEVQQLIRQGLDHLGYNQGAAQALLECHYSLHGAFLLEQPLLDHMNGIRHIPCIAVQGQADIVCPPITAVELGRAWPEMELRLVPGAGHSMYDPAITHELVNATDRMRALVLQPAPVGSAAMN